MSPPNAKRDQTLNLLIGPAIKVTIKPSYGKEKTWALPLALLCHHAGYFARLHNFKEGEEGAVVLAEFEPDIFNLFVEFMYFGRYSYRDDLNDPMRIRDSAKTWILGDYLDAVEFKNFAMRKLYDIYLPAGGGKPKAAITAFTVKYILERVLTGSPLETLYKHVLVKYYHDTLVVKNEMKDVHSWNEVWDRFAVFRNDLLYFLNQGESARETMVGRVEEYMEKREATKDSVEPDAV